MNIWCGPTSTVSYRWGPQVAISGPKFDEINFNLADCPPEDLFSSSLDLPTRARLTAAAAAIVAGLFLITSTLHLELFRLQQPLYQLWPLIAFNCSERRADKKNVQVLCRWLLSYLVGTSTWPSDHCPLWGQQTLASSSQPLLGVSSGRIKN